MAIDPTSEVAHPNDNQQVDLTNSAQSQPHSAGGSADNELGQSAAFQLSIFIPRPKFCPEVKVATAEATEGYQDPEATFIELILPVNGPETIRELLQSVIESAEGWWLGSIGLASVELDKNGKPDPQQSSTRTIYGEFAELSSAFQSEKFKDPNVKRALLAVNIDYTEYTARLHVIRMRDVLHAQAPGLLIGNSKPLPTYDPSQIGIGGAISLFPIVRGDHRSDSTGLLPTDQIIPEIDQQTNSSANKNKKKKKPAQSPQVPTNVPQANPDLPMEQTAIANLANYRYDSAKPFAALDPVRKINTESCGPHPSVCYLKSFGLSNWNPPPHNFRLRGHYLYLAVTTLENATYELTCHTRGFYVSKSTSGHFDPSPSTSSPDFIYFSTLSHLFCYYSPLFVKGITTTWNRALNPTFPDFFTSLPITNCLPAFPWLVQPEKPFPDAIRSQLAYLITGSTTAETLPPARDWADEFAQARELPRKTLAERTLRERIWSRLQSDFSMAATRGVISCSRGEVPALNPQEPEAAWTYVLNNILFSRAEDPIGAYEHLGGTAAARAIASKDLYSIKHLNQLDVPGIFTMGSAVIDYHGKRWIAQGMIPGIFRPPDLEVEKARQENSAKQTVTNGLPSPDDKDESDWEKVNASVPATPQLNISNLSDEFSPPTTYDILYGSADIEKPEMGLRSDPKFHRLAAHVASGFNLAEHNVKDANGREHCLWLSADVHGIRATDGRCYLIDLYRMTPPDVYFIEKDINGPILDGKTPTDRPTTKLSQDFAFPHRFTLVRMEAISAFKQYKFRQFAVDHIQKRQQTQKSQASQSTNTVGEGGKTCEESKDELGEEVLVNQTPLAEENSQELEKENFKFRLNPDAFVDRKDQPWIVPQDQEDDSVALVRELSKFVREQLLANVVQELSELKGLPADGRRLSDLLHSHGVNIRYLGHITHRLQLAANEPLASQQNKEDQHVVLQASIGLLQSEMVFRASKHILNRMLLSTSETEACHCISHFLNCLLGQSPAIPSSEPHLDQSAPWRTCTRQSLRTQLTSEIRRRFRYNLPSSFFSQRLARTKIQMLREICTRMGIQLYLRDYKLSPPADVTANGHSPTGKESIRSSPEPARYPEEPAPVLQGQMNSTDDEHSLEGVTVSDGPTSATPKLSKKKKKSKSKKATCDSSGSNADGQTFSPSDILNLLPIVRDSTCRSIVADELYAEGRKAFATGDIALGQELCTDALTTYEQVFGSIHPEMCRHWHSLAILYHQLSQRALVELSEYNDRLLELSALYHASNNEEDRGKIKQRIESYQRDREPEAVRNEIDTYVQLAANNLRQSVIAAERTLGLDHPETIQQYSDLSVMEYHLGNTDTAMRYTKHALDLWHLVYGPGCHPDASASVTHAGVLVQSTLDPTKSTRADSIFGLSQSLIGSFFGTDSAKFAEATLILSQMFAQGGEKELAIKYGLQAKRLYTNRFGEDHELTKHANQLYESITRSIEAQIKGDEEKSARLAKRLGLDPKRAASLRARLLASSSSTPAADTSLSKKTNAGLGFVTPKTSFTPKVPPRAQNGTPVSIDELVKYIQGSTDVKVSKSNHNNSASTKIGR